MTEIIHTFLQEHLYRSALVIAICMGALIISMGVDLFFGIKKAKENGLATTSTGFKKTCDKARKYFSPFMVTVCIDLIACTVLPFPVFSMIWAGYCVFCEFVSVREKSWQGRKKGGIPLKLSPANGTKSALIAGLLVMPKK